LLFILCRAGAIPQLSFGLTPRTKGTPLFLFSAPAGGKQLQQKDEGRGCVAKGGKKRRSIAAPALLAKGR